ncbi:hypothetical protein H0H81_004969 [Sphagnurus paluster]|uniref:Mucoidy inhibitor A n=1 Tax=Sphagnurus paluster TaxID=117069 RepID=A0A9P7FW25_9AGAR|nr:hypothetical protein H0H81_004969 [Sphagnurus paluster]
MATPQDIPPPFEPTNVIDLVSVEDSKIVRVSLYSGRAEITRLYKFQVRTGQNQVNINGLPNVLDRDSLRVEGRGTATIHDVVLSDIPSPPMPTTSARLDELSSEKELEEKALARAKKGMQSLEAYLTTLDVQHTDVETLDKVIEHYDTSGSKLDRKILELEKKIKRLASEIEAERKTFVGTPKNQKLGVRAAISVFAPSGGEVAVALIYAVRSANWTAGYDIRVDMQSKEKPVTLIYKAIITQDTGEAWDDISLTLETASPTFGVGIPTLRPWNLSVYRPPNLSRSKKSGGPLPSMQMSLRYASTAAEVAPQSEDDDDMGFGLFDGSADEMTHRISAITSKGGISATFEVPGSITVPSDGASHNVTVAELTLDAVMSWVTVPKVDIKTHLKAKVKNASEYTLLPGIASVYVDGSFISRSNVPLVSPLESFDCPLGLDPSIRVTYHPRTKKVSQSGFYAKSSNHVFSQRITVFNTKSVPVENFKVIEQLPVSESSQITVKLLSPGLALPDSATPSTVKGKGPGEGPLSIKVSDGVFAQWEGADESDVDLEALGRDGRFNWLCAVPAQAKINLLLSWEVTAPLRTQITGL